MTQHSRQHHKSRFEAALATLTNEPTEVCSNVITRAESCLEQYRADGTARKDSLMLIALASALVFGWLGALAAAGGAIASGVALWAGKGSLSLAGVSVVAPALVATLSFMLARRWDPKTATRERYTELTECLELLPNRLAHEALALSSTTEEARQFHAKAIDQCGQLRYFHLTELEQLSGKPTADELAEDKGFDRLTVVSTLIGDALIVALLAVTIWYGAFGGRT